ncbi:MAG: hypothetical protein DMF89_24860 [Acidobacteria bacterium]|nr:MAG: hypothetical protein DMF89_24860 [Acidobacteriota bacterium]
MRLLPAALASTAALCVLLAGSVHAQDAKTATRSTLAGSARVERVDRSSRILTIRTDPGSTRDVYVGPELKIFDELQMGDTVTVRYVDSIVVAVRPGAKPQFSTDTTGAAQKARAGSESETRLVENPKLLEGLKPGDVVEVTVTRERAIELRKSR